jgi:hypothetical protein
VGLHEGGVHQRVVVDELDDEPDPVRLLGVEHPAVSISSCARDAPTRRGSSQLVPMSQADSPMRMNAALNFADRAASRMSLPSTSANPSAGGTVHGGDHRLRQRAHLRDQRRDVLLRREPRLRAPRCAEFGAAP